MVLPSDSLLSFINTLNDIIVTLILQSQKTKYKQKKKKDEEA